MSEWYSAVTVGDVRRLGVIALFIWTATACSASTDLPAGVIALSSPAPAVSGPRLGGGSFGPAQYRGKALVVNFFNPFCPPCRQEQPVLERSWRHLRDRGVQFVGVHYVGGDWPSSVSAARKYLERDDVTYPILQNPDSALARELGIQGIPSTVIIDGAGRVRFRILGRVRPGEASRLIASL